MKGTPPKKGTKSSAVRKLTGRALMFELIRCTGLPAGKPKTGKICGKVAPFNPMNYPDRPQVVSYIH
jgi:hypothetical protein